MSKNIAKVVAGAMREMSLPYAFGTFKANPIPSMYWVGEYSEMEPITEDGMQDSMFILTGFCRGEWEELETARELIENYFNKVYGKTVIVDNGDAVAVFYAYSLIVPTGDAELKEMQINLHCKEWKVN